MVVHNHILDKAHAGPAIWAFAAGAGFIDLRRCIANVRARERAFDVLVRERIAHAYIHIVVFPVCPHQIRWNKKTLG